jgi:hypothetical protein
MGLYYNTQTGEYPLFIGDIQIIDKSWDENKQLPKNIVSVAEIEIPEEIEGKHIIELKPELIDEVWKQKFGYRDLTQKEIAEIGLIKRPKNMPFWDQ